MVLFALGATLIIFFQKLYSFNCVFFSKLHTLSSLFTCKDFGFLNHVCNPFSSSYRWISLSNKKVQIFSKKKKKKKVQNTEFGDALIRVFQDLMFSNLDQCENKNSCVRVCVHLDLETYFAKWWAL